MKQEIKKSGIYEHYKGNQYKVIDVATHSETMEPMVVYQTLYGNFDLWVRPLAMFTEDVTVMIEGVETTKPRFAYVKQSV